MTVFLSARVCTAAASAAATIVSALPCFFPTAAASQHAIENRDLLQLQLNIYWAACDGFSMEAVKRRC